jgi:hypothetical protein
MSRINNFSTDSWEDMVVKERRCAKFSGQEEVSVIEIGTSAEELEMMRENEQVQGIN